MDEACIGFGQMEWKRAKKKLQLSIPVRKLLK